MLPVRRVKYAVQRKTLAYAVFMLTTVIICTQFLLFLMYKLYICVGLDPSHMMREDNQ